MNVHASALAEAHLPDEQTTAFAREAIEDLSQQPKKLSPKYFYDATGSELFEAITRLPEYYPTRTELSILKARGGEIAKIIPEHAEKARAFIREHPGMTVKQLIAAGSGIGLDYERNWWTDRRLETRGGGCVVRSE